ncbi:MAG: eight-cysteine-cluster domain-containing protein [Nanoarchaeota archaeon]|nr:eight-cysteine-cluster domain-containing protein [Nanoarchaeota archaeon]
MNDKRIFILILSIILISGCGAYTDVQKSVQQDRVLEVNQFCGASTEYVCEADDECITSGCSGHICQGKAEEQSITTCDYKDCYDAQKHNVRCACDYGTCKWKGNQK